jgi:hypothetical protein
MDAPNEKEGINVKAIVLIRASPARIPADLFIPSLFLNSKNKGYIRYSCISRARLQKDALMLKKV